MKKLIIITATLFALVSTTMAIPKTYADIIVLGYLEKETRTHTVFAKDVVQTGFTIFTSNGKIFELNYSCWIYYVSYADNIAGKYIIVNDSNSNVLEVKTTSDAEPEDIAEWRDVTNTPKIVACDFQNPLVDLPWLKEKIANFQENSNADIIAIYQCSVTKHTLNPNVSNIGFLIYEDGIQHFYNCNGEELYIEDELYVNEYLLYMLWQELIWKKTKEEYNGNLLHTKWKLLGIGSVDTEVLQELEPKDCKDCYTLTFNTDSTFQTIPVLSGALGQFTADYTTHVFQTSLAYKISETNDGDLYASIFYKKKIQSFLLQENELRLFYNENENYLLFKPAEL